MAESVWAWDNGPRDSQQAWTMTKAFEGGPESGRHLFEGRVRDAADQVREEKTMRSMTAAGCC